MVWPSELSCCCCCCCCDDDPIASSKAAAAREHLAKAEQVQFGASCKQFESWEPLIEPSITTAPRHPESIPSCDQLSAITVEMNAREPCLALSKCPEQSGRPCEALKPSWTSFKFSQPLRKLFLFVFRLFKTCGLTDMHTQMQKYALTAGPDHLMASMEYSQVQKLRQR